MDNNEQDQADMDTEDTSSEQFVHSESPYSSDTFGESELHPRVGDEYQAAIPSLLTSSEKLRYLSNLCDSQPLADASHSFLIGLPIPITLTNNEGHYIKDEKIGDHDSVGCSKMEPNECVIDGSSVSDKKEHGANSCGFVPGLQSDSWSEFEAECFLLGLYLFGKNLVQVQRFMEGKEMGQMLSFYYGRFYRTTKYQRWADCRKVKGRKCIIGQRIISGSRQLELLSRLLPHLSEVSQNTAVEAYKTFMEGRTSLEEYISTVKSMVGIHALVEAVRIGKENEDLIVMAMESSRANASVSSRHETPSGKACSSLTYEEIVKYLTGEFRLSKARSSDLFWEAVWPRLLYKGWHSEEPKDEAYIRGSKNPLVFLLPGISKFRRKLLRGYHYFDSVSDVLKKVSSDPKLLVLESEENGTISSVKENVSSSDGASDLELHHYLKPRSSSDETNQMKFTVVDTSLFNEDGRSKVREMRSLPPEMKASLSRGREPRMTEADNVPTSVEHNADHGLKRRKLNPGSKAEKKRFIRRCSESVVTPTVVVFSLPAHPKKAARKYKIFLRAPKNEDPAEGSSCSLATKNEAHQSEPLINLNVTEVAVEHEANKATNLKAVDDNHVSSQNEEEETRVKVEEGNHLLIQNGSNEANPHLEHAEQDEQAIGSGRRHSTRVRPLSTKALEALETSFSSPKTGKRGSQGEGERPKKAYKRRSKVAVDPVMVDSEAMRYDHIQNA